MHDFFRLKVVSKRQVTLPQLLLEKLHLQEGDELEVEVANGAIVSVRPLKLVPTDFFNDGMLQKLEERSRNMDAGRKAHSPRQIAAAEQSPQPRRASLSAKVNREENVSSSSGA